VKWLAAYNRPILCTEYMARGNGSTFQSTLPIAKQYKVAAINWVSWRERSRPRCMGLVEIAIYGSGTPVWFHDIFLKDGTP